MGPLKPILGYQLKNICLQTFSALEQGLANTDHEPHPASACFVHKVLLETAMFPCWHIVCGRFRASRAGLGSCHRNHQACEAWNSHHLTLYRKDLLTSIPEPSISINFSLFNLSSWGSTKPEALLYLTSVWKVLVRVEFCFSEYNLNVGEFCVE